MTGSDGDEVLERWPRTVRDLGHDALADVLDAWLDAEGASIRWPDGVPPMQAEPTLREAGAAFAALGSRARAAGLELEALHAAMRALIAALAGPDDGRRGGLVALHGVAAGGWHVGSPGPSGPSGDAAGGRSGDRELRLSPELGKLIRHDIKTPLQAASLNLELLAMEHESDPGVTGAIDTIMASLDSAVTMLQRFDEH